MDIVKCAIYTRVSSYRQADIEDGSLDAQEAKIKAYIEYENKHNSKKWELVDIYREEGRSGKNLKRPEFKRLMQDIDDKKINAVLIWKIDRLTRSIKDFSSVWENLQSKNIQLISLNEKFDTSTAIGRAMLSIILVFAQLEREQTGERTVATLQYRAEQGLRNGGRVIGYDIDPENKGVFKINKKDAEMVKKAFKLCIETGSAGQTQRILQEKGYKMPVYESRRGKNHGGTAFNKQAIIRMLTNPAYIGKISWSGSLYDGKHKAIIDKRTFMKVQKLLDKNRVTRSNDKLPKLHVYLLKGILKCGKCGSMMVPKSGLNGSGKPYHYYQCTRNIHVGKSGCEARYVPAKSIEDLVVERVKELSMDKKEIDQIIRKANKNMDAKLKEHQSEKKRLFCQMQEIDKKLEKMVDSVENGGVAAFKAIKNRMLNLEKEKESIETRLSDMSFETDKLKEQCLSAEAMYDSFSSFKDVLKKANKQELKELIYRIVEVVEWHERDKASGHCRISYFEQPKLVANDKLFAESNNWLPD
ncbi:recombinase family protein [Candidatus Woesearchaeota archaeon]|nr:recombinase family protein [Candidatus Woesearchaeota archaeon]